MSLTPKTFDTCLNEQSTAVYTATLEDENGTSIGSGAIDAITLTLSNVADGAIINSRNVQNVLNLNDVTITGGGLLTFTLQPADTTIIDTTQDFETHRATFQMQFNSVSYHNWDVDFRIRNLTKVP